MANNELLSEESVRQLINDLISIEAAAREAQLSQEAQIRQTEDETIRQLLSQEVDDRIASVSALQLSANQSITRIDGNVTQLQNLFNQRYDQIIRLISDLNVSLEDRTNFDAKAYTDEKIASILNNAPAVLDTLNELANAIGNDGNFVTTINTSIQEAKNIANANKQEILGLLSNNLIKKEKIVITQQHINQGYIELNAIDIIHDSVVAFLDRLGIFEEEDFQLIEINGKTRMVFINNLAVNGDEAVEAGSELRVKYWTV